jgi:hypothetical protein
MTFPAQLETAAVLPARIDGAPMNTPSKLVIVEDPDTGPVVVRWLAGSEDWRCGTCGPMSRAECAHTFSAGLVLAESMFGLTRTPDLQPAHERETSHAR